MQRAEVNPIRSQCGEGREVLFTRAHQIVSGRAVKMERGLTVAVELHGNCACSGRNALNESWRKAQLLHLRVGPRAALIRAQAANEEDLVTQQVRMRAEIERRAAQTLAVLKNIPEDLANADDFHRSLYCTGFAKISTHCPRRSHLATGRSPRMCRTSSEFICGSYS